MSISLSICLSVCQVEEVFDVTDSHFEFFPEHKLFLENLNEAKETAAKNQSRVYITWRGYRAFVTPGKKRLDKKEFQRHLIVALKTIKPISKEEEDVSLLLLNVSYAAANA